MAEKVSIQGNVIEVTKTERNTTCHALIIDANHYMNLDTGEIGEFERCSESRVDNTKVLRKTFKALRSLINTNCTDPWKLRWITLTYAENMQDTERLYKDFGNFMKRFRRRFGKCEYISVAEPQERGAWHLHLIAIYACAAPFIPNDQLRECWGHGFVRVQSLKDIDNIGAYLSAYLADLPTDGTSGELKTCKDGSTKRIVKGGRLSMYPVGMNIYRCSRGIKRPVEFWVEGPSDEEKRNALLQSATQTFADVYEWTDESGRFHRVEKSYYNTVRKSQSTS